MKMNQLWTWGARVIQRSAYRRSRENPKQGPEPSWFWSETQRTHWRRISDQWQILHRQTYTAPIDIMPATIHFSFLLSLVFRTIEIGRRMNIRSVLALRAAWAYAVPNADPRGSHWFASLRRQYLSPDGTPHWKITKKKYPRLYSENIDTVIHTSCLCLGYGNTRMKNRPSAILKTPIVNMYNASTATRILRIDQHWNVMESGCGGQTFILLVISWYENATLSGIMADTTIRQTQKAVNENCVC